MSAKSKGRLTSVTSLDAAAALMCRLGCRTVDVQSRARANVPTDRAITMNWSMDRSDKWLAVGLQTNSSRSSSFRVSTSPARQTSHTRLSIVYTARVFTIFLGKFLTFWLNVTFPWLQTFLPFYAGFPVLLGTLMAYPDSLNGTGTRTNIMLNTSHYNLNGTGITQRLL